jgi:YHS domain-containing protein
MLTIENVNKISGYALEVKGKGYYFRGFDNTTNDVTIFVLAGVSASNPLIRITLHKKGRMSINHIQNTSCYVYGIEVDGLTFYFTKEKLNTPAEFRNTIEQILNGI